MATLRSIMNSIGSAVYPRWGGSGWPSSTVVVPGTPYDYETEAGDLWANSVVSIAIKWLGDRFPRPRVQVSRIQRDGKWEPVPNHPVEMLWKRPNPYYTRRILEKALGLSLIVDGNGYVQKVRNGAGKVAELWWLPHTIVEPYWEGDDFITGYQVNVPGRPRDRLPRADVIHIRDGVDMLNPRKGCSAVKQQLRQVATVNEEGSYTASILRNAGVTSIVLIPSDPNNRITNEDQANKIKNAFASKTTGENRGKVVVLGGPFNLHTPGFSPEQLAVDKLTQSAMSRIGAACGVPLMAMGLPDPDKTYSNIESAIKTGWGAVCSIQEMIGEAATDDLLPEFGLDPSMYAVSYDYGDIQELQESEDAVHKRVRDDWLGNVITQNEARDLIGMDEDAEGDRYFYEIQTSVASSQAGALAAAQTEGAPNSQPPKASANGNGRYGKRWEY